MSTLTICIIVAFCVGYLFIALESVTKVNKAAIALLMFAVCWTLLMFSPESYFPNLTGQDLINTVSSAIEHLSLIHIVDQNGGFNWVRSALQTRSKRALLWRIAFMTFVLSAILDNLTTSIVMVMILRKLVQDHKDRLVYASLVIIAANSGGAFSPIGDVTTIMLWNKGVITAAGVISEIIVPSIISMVVPAFIMQYMLKGELQIKEEATNEDSTVKVEHLSDSQRKSVFFIGVGGLMMVPVFKAITHLPPFVGILLVLSILWTVTEVFYYNLPHESDKEGTGKRVTNLLRNIDMSTILFFLGILMAVACLEQIGVLTTLGKGLNVAFNNNHYIVTGIIGVLSSIVDNVPLVAGSMGMYPVEAAGDMAIDGIFWQLLAYCAGVGGSMLIIGSAAGVVVMGLEKITFGWYMKHITWIAFVGYIAGILSYWVIRTCILTTPI